ncbi:MAG: response regulator [Deltaproteobacteria bacterium]|nr:response regulator [Deltaproteobacteria bacterium]
MPKRVIIADDTDFFRAVLCDILSKGGYEVVGQAVNGEEALRLVSELRPDIIILDIIMPVKNGIEVAKEISLMEGAPKIVMCTSLGYEPIVDEAIRSGACAYIIKPLSTEKVLRTLDCI